MSTIAEDSAFIEMMATAFERYGVDVAVIRGDYWRLCDIAGVNAPSARGVGIGTTAMPLSEARALVNTAREVLVQRITHRLEA